jgi:hypothetical protein
VAESQLTKIVREHYEERAESGDEFGLDEIEQAVHDDPALDSVTDELVEAAIAGAVRRVDDARTKANTEQLTMFGDSDQVVPIGEGRRRRRGSLRADNALKHLALVDENEAQVIAAAAKERGRVRSLLPYLTAAPIDWDEAVRRYETDHPELGQ